MRMRVCLAVLSTLFCPIIALGSDWVADDLRTFVTRPDIVVPKVNVTTYDVENVQPGYWFMSMYEDTRKIGVKYINQSSHVGPHIFDSNGDLVWSGAAILAGRTVHHFKPVNIQGVPKLAMLMTPSSEVLTRGKSLGTIKPQNTTFPNGTILVLDSSYRIESAISIDFVDDPTYIDMHELLFPGNGETFLVISHDVKYWNGSGELQPGYVAINYFREIEVKSGRVLFIWSSFDHVSPLQSLEPKPDGWGGDPIQDEQEALSHPPVVWDYFHMNSVDKDENGDYLVSARFTSSIYKISGVDGSIMWTFGGKQSDFSIDERDLQIPGFQHDARFHGNSGHGNGTELISFLNNGLPGITDPSCGILMGLHHEENIAKVVQAWCRPDGQVSGSKGNVQILSAPGMSDTNVDTDVDEEHNVVIGWGINGYASEFSMSGDLVQDIRFLGPRYLTYRIMKAQFDGSPTLDDFVVKSRSEYKNPSTKRDLVTSVYVSWNGATEVKTWNIFGSQNLDEARNPSSWTFLGSISKVGFETSWHTGGFFEFVRVQALDAHGKELGVSSATMTIAPVPNCDHESCLAISAGTFQPGLDATSKLSSQMSTSGDKYTASFLLLTIRKPSLSVALIGLAASIALITGLIMTRNLARTRKRYINISENIQ